MSFHVKTKVVQHVPRINRHGHLYRHNYIQRHNTDTFGSQLLSKSFYLKKGRKKYRTFSRLDSQNVGQIKSEIILIFSYKEKKPHLVGADKSAFLPYRMTNCRGAVWWRPSPLDGVCCSCFIFPGLSHSRRTITRWSPDVRTQSR